MITIPRTERDYNALKAKSYNDLINHELQKLDGQLFSGRKILAKIVQTEEFGQNLSTKIQRAKELSTDYKFSDEQIQNIWNKKHQFEWERKEFSDMPSFTEKLEYLAEYFSLKPVKTEEKFLSALLPGWSFCKRDFWVYEVMSHDSSTLFVEAFIRVGKPYTRCWRALVVDNDTGQLHYIPEEQTWRENFRSFMNELEMVIVTPK